MRGTARVAVMAVALLPAMADMVRAADAPQVTVTKVIDSGPDGTKLNIAVLGDGYAAADQQKFNQDVDRLLVQGVFGRDFFQQYRSAFNVYRVNLVSKDSGVSQKRYDEHGTPADPSDDTVISRTDRDTALRFIWSGSWAHCWLEKSDQTQALLDAALADYVPTYTYLLVILNQDSYGGCGGSGQQFVPRGVTWDVIAHEYGHGIGGLYDEYWNPGTAYQGGEVNGPNISTVLDRTRVAWHDLIAGSTGVPTELVAGMDANRTVGEFEGGGTVEKGVYRPVFDCRMRSNAPPYCPVCTRIMYDIVSPHLNSPARSWGGPPPSAAAVGGGLHMLTPAALRGGVSAVRPAGILSGPHGGDRSDERAKDPPAPPQGPAPAPPTAGGPGKPDSYLQMVVRVDRGGKARVVNAVEVPGPVIVSNVKAGNFVYEVTAKGDKPVIVRSLPDPFEGRSFPSPPTPESPAGKPEGHHEDARKEATIVVRVPNTTLEEAVKGDLAIKFYMVTPGPQVIHTLDAHAMGTLRAANRLQLTQQIPAEELATQLRQVGKKLDRR